MVKNKDYTRMIILSRSRTGSNLLMSLLNSHPKVHIHGEVFDWLRGRTCKEIYEETFPEIAEVDCLGFKIFYTHPIDDQEKSVWEMLKNDRSLKIVHLVRKNMLRTYVSQAIAEKNDIWTSQMGAATDEEKVVHIDFDKLMFDFKLTEQFVYLSKQYFTHHRHIEVTYDELINGQKKILSKV